ncbi:hypothetical protein [Caballeronia sp. SBC2]|uniref:hypothetical protein n=1 Tax=Caballeronia sp. SBC2 TaxID=2705547 RepID=UPI0013ED312E|nr:hypothetical protein [Caballeronia sp. SBC2]
MRTHLSSVLRDLIAKIGSKSLGLIKPVSGIAYCPSVMGFSGKCFILMASLFVSRLRKRSSKSHKDIALRGKNASLFGSTLIYEVQRTNKFSETQRYCFPTRLEQARWTMPHGRMVSRLAALANHWTIVLTATQHFGNGSVDSLMGGPSLCVLSLTTG